MIETTLIIIIQYNIICLLEFMDLKYPVNSTAAQITEAIGIFEFFTGKRKVRGKMTARLQTLTAVKYLFALAQVNLAKSSEAANKIPRFFVM